MPAQQKRQDQKTMRNLKCVSISIGIVLVLWGCNAINPQPVRPPVYPTAVLRATPARVQVPGQVKLETQVVGICPDLHVPQMQYRITIKSGHDTVADGVTTVNSGVSFTSEQSWNAQARQSGVPNQGNVVPELKTLVQLSPSEAIQSPAVPLEVSVP
jgi:hypothetical protein